MNKTYLIHYRDRSVIPARWAFEEVSSKNKAELFSKHLPDMGIPECDVVLAVEMGVHMMEKMSDTQDPDEGASLSDFPECNFKEPEPYGNAKTQTTELPDNEVLISETEGHGI